MNDGSYTSDMSVLRNGTELCGGAYRIVQKVGQGGFGITYKAVDVATGGFVALKECFPKEHVHRSNNAVYPNSDTSRMLDNSIRWFWNEAETLAALDDPGIVKIKRYFDENRTAYMVLEFLDGETIYHRCERMRAAGHRMELDEFFKIARHVVGALATVHENDVLHRDLTPQNIMLRAGSGQPVLIDFGSARQQLDQEASLTHGANFTAVLNRQYAPPEQHYNRGRLPADDSLIGEAMPTSNTKGQGPWTDIFALCGTFYFMLTGKHPPSALERLQELYDSLPDPLHLSENELGYPAHVLRAIEAGLSLRVHSRPQDVAQLYTLLLGRQAPRAAPRAAEQPAGPAATPRPSTVQPESGYDERPEGVTEPTDWGAAAPSSLPDDVATPADTGHPQPLAKPRSQPFQRLTSMIRRFLTDDTVPDTAARKGLFKDELDLGARVEAIAFDRRSEWIAAATAGGTIVLRYLGRNGGQHLLSYTDAAITCILPAPFWNGVLVGDNKGRVALLDVAMSSIAWRFTAGSGAVTHISITADAQMLVVATATSDSGQIMAYSTAQSRDFLGPLHGDLQEPFSSLAFLTQHRVLVAASRSGRILMRGLAPGGQGRIIPLRGVLRPGSVALAENGETAIALGTAGTIERFQTKSGAPLQQVPQPYSPVTRTAATSIGGRAATAWEQGRVTLWDATAMTELRNFVDHRGQVSQLAFSPARRLLATAGDDGKVFVYDYVDM